MQKNIGNMGLREGSKLAWMAARASWLLLVPAGDAFANELSFTLDVASDYVEHGLTRSQGEPAVRGLASWSFGDGWALGVGAATLNLNPGRGAARELDLYLSKHVSFGDRWSLHAGIARYDFGPDTARFSYDYNEVTAALSYRELLTLTVGYSPDYSLFARGVPAYERAAINTSIAFRYPARRWLNFTTGVGRYDLSDLFGREFWYWTAAAQADFGRNSLAVSLIDTDHTADSLFGSRFAGRRVVASLAVRLR